LFFRLKKYVYGTQEASKRFFDTMCAFLLSLGFVQSTCDRCLFILYKDDDMVVAGIYVDDLLLTATTIILMAWISTAFRTKWDTVHHVGTEFNYVGLHIVRNRADRSIRIDMSGNVKKVIEQFGTDVKPSSVPCVSGILDQTGTPLNSVDRSRYMSLVMSVLYPARLCHMAVMFATTILATRMHAPTDHDLKHAYRLIGFLKTQVNGGFTLRGTPQSRLRMFVDASHSIHPDGKGHGCLIACMDDSPIAWRSYKLQHVCLSSTESEISSVSESTTYVVWLVDLLKQLRHLIDGPVEIPQDNNSAMLIMENGGSFKRTKHIMTRYMFIQEHVKAGLIWFSCCPTAEHVADLLTKPQPATQLMSLLLRLQWSSSSEGV
jgi:hypothetical protein